MTHTFRRILTYTGPLDVIADLAKSSRANTSAVLSVPYVTATVTTSKVRPITPSPKRPTNYPLPSRGHHALNLSSPAPDPATTPISARRWPC